MGCDIHVYTDPEVDYIPFDWRSYGMFAFLAGVRNYSCIPPISEPRGLPDDLPKHIKNQEKDFYYDGHTHSWLTIDELLAFDYSQVFENRRICKQITSNVYSGSEIANLGEGELITYYDFLGTDFFDDLNRLKEDDVKRIIFWFDS